MSSRYNLTYRLGVLKRRRIAKTREQEENRRQQEALQQQRKAEAERRQKLAYEIASSRLQPSRKTTT